MAPPAVHAGGVEAASNGAGTDGVTMRWAHPVQRSGIHREPAMASPVFKRLRPLTAEGFPEVYRVIEEKDDADGRTWTKIGIPARPNGQTGWVNSRFLGEVYESRSRLTISRLKKVARLWRYTPGVARPKLLWAAKVGVGAKGTPTPAGNFWIRERILNLNGNPMYGPVAFGTSAYSRLSDWPGGGVIGIHGTNQPGLIPGAISHGCVRVRNGQIRSLAKRMKIGTPVEIR